MIYLLIDPSSSLSITIDSNILNINKEGFILFIDLFLLLNLLILSILFE